MRRYLISDEGPCGQTAGFGSRRRAIDYASGRATLGHGCVIVARFRRDGAMVVVASFTAHEPRTGGRDAA